MDHRADDRGGDATRWRDAALCALVIGTVGAVNTTALLMIAPPRCCGCSSPSPSARSRRARAVAAAARIGGLALGTSAWWLAMQVIQGRHGADLLAYSESLEDVSLTATSSEAWRSLAGYWLMYVRDPYAPTTTAGRLHDRPRADRLRIRPRRRRPDRARRRQLPRTALRHRHDVHRARPRRRRPPFGSPSPIARLFRGDGQEGLSLALRSSTPRSRCWSIGLALGTAALVDAIGRAGAWRRIALAATVVVVVALGNLPVLTGADLVDPALERDEQPPDGVDEAAAASTSWSRRRVLQLPGAEFGAFTWGYTVDPPLPGLTEPAVVTRDLLPSVRRRRWTCSMPWTTASRPDRAELAAVAPIARLFGADTIWLPGDAAFDRFRTPRPELTAELFAAGGDGPRPPGDVRRACRQRPQVPMVDEQSLSEPAVGTAIAPVALVPVVDPLPVVRASDTSRPPVGSGDGLVDAAAAGLIVGDEAIRYSASMTADELVEAAGDRRPAGRHRHQPAAGPPLAGFQDVTGYTEPATGPQTVWDDSGDARLDVFPGAGIAASTVAVQDGPVSAGGEQLRRALGYLPEARPAMASTAT